MQTVKSVANGILSTRHIASLTALTAVFVIVVIGCVKSCSSHNPILYLDIISKSRSDTPIHVEVAIDGRVIFDKKVPLPDERHANVLPRKKVTVSTRILEGVHTIAVRSKMTKAVGSFEFRAKPTNWIYVIYKDDEDDTEHSARLPGSFCIEQDTGPFLIE